MRALPLALVCALALVGDALAGGDRAQRLDLSVAPVYSLAVGHGYGGQVALTHGWRAWSADRRAGTLEGGLLVGYQREPFDQLLGSYLGDAELSGATHRLQALVIVGHTLRALPPRRLQLSVYVFGGIARALLRGHLLNERLGVDEPCGETGTALAYGVGFAPGVALSDRVALVFDLRAPLPCAPTAVIGTLYASLGVVVRL